MSIATTLQEVQTKGYIPTHSITGAPIGASLIFKEPIAGMQHAELIMRADAEAVIATIKDEHDERGIDIDLLKKEIERLNRVVEAWREDAARYHRNECFWQAIVHNIGRAIGRPAYISNDGSVQADPLALVVEEIVVKAYLPKNRLLRALRMLLKGL